MKRKYKTIVVEDEKLIRDNIIQKVTQCDSDFIICGHAADGQEALKLVNEIIPDVVITDIRMPQLDGLELIKRIKSLHPHIMIIIISGYADFSYAQIALRLKIEDYILKPIKVEDLKKILNNVKGKLNSIKYNFLLNKWTDLVSCDKYVDFPKELLQSNNTLALVNIGNLCAGFTSIDLRTYYEEIWSKINIENKSSDKMDIFMISENMPNSKLLVFSDFENSDSESVIMDMFSYMKRILGDININIIYCRPESISNISNIVAQLRITLHQQLIMGKDKILSLDNKAVDLSPVIIDSILRSKIIHLINEDDFESLKIILLSEIKNAIDTGKPQAWIKDYIHQLLRLLQGYSKTISEAELQHVEYVLFDNMSYPLTIDITCKNIDDTLSIILHNSSDELDVENDWIKDIKAYLLENYCEDISLDDISKKFNYTSSHLIKLFKRQTGETPMKYIINLRISTAKTLLKDNPAMDIKQICECVGYYDQHYFSRIFKCITGITPSAYRQKHIRKPS